MSLKQKLREPGFVLSGVGHAALLVALLVSVSAESFPEGQEGIPVEIITDNQLSEITKGETSAAKAEPDPKPRVDRVSDKRQESDPGEAARDVPAPPKRPAEMKVADEATEAAASPPPPPTRTAEVRPPEPPRRDEAKAAAEAEAKAQAARAAEAKAKAEAKAEAEQKAAEAERVAAEKAAEAKAKAEADQKAAEAKAKAEADAKARAEAKAQAEAKARAEAEAREKAVKEAEAKALAEAKKKEAEAKALAEAKKKAEAEAKAKKQAELAEKFDAGSIARLLQSKEQAQSTGNTGEAVQRTASLGTATGTASRLNPSQRDALIGIIQGQLHRCWQAPMAAQESDRAPVASIRVRLNQDGSLAAEPTVANTSSDPMFRVVADSATRATRRCAPLRIPAQFQPYYQDWKDLVVNFDPRET